MPTLTTVVEPSSLLSAVAADATPAAPEMPPARLPESPLAFHSASEERAALMPTAMVSDADAFRFEEGLLHRVLQRIDLSLEARLTDTVSAAVQQQLDAMLPRLRDEIEGVLRELVVEALARELAENTGSTTGQRT
ncbi:hypothetical protein [Variovorax sp. dw_954]|uniref:hypothetical protein n=1 Tax=unclassified Variovorax TaxID=663243 RepID=UPI0031F61B66